MVIDQFAFGFVKACGFELFLGWDCERAELESCKFGK